MNIEEPARTLVLEFSRILKARPEVSGFELLLEVYEEVNSEAVFDEKGSWNQTFNKQLQSRSVLQIISFFDDFAAMKIIESQAGSSALLFEQGYDAESEIEAFVRDRLAHQKPIVRRWNQEMFYCGTKTADPRAGKITDADRIELVNWNLDTAKHRQAKIVAERFQLREITGARLFCSNQISVLCEPITFFECEAKAHFPLPASNSLKHISSRVQSHRFADICSQPIVASAVRNELSILAPVSSAVAAEIMARDPLFFMCPQVVAAVVEKLAPMFEATQIKEKQNCLSEHWGKTVFSSKVHLIDDPQLDAGLRTRHFDARGMPSSSITLICEGRLDALYASLEESERYRIAPTGHAKIGRGIWSGNLLVMPGRRSKNMILAERSPGVHIAHLLSPVSIDAQSGAIELEVELRVLGMGPGIDGRSMGRYRIRTDIFRMLGSVVECINDQVRVGAVDACTWVLDQLELEFLS